MISSVLLLVEFDDSRTRVKRLPYKAAKFPFVLVAAVSNLRYGLTQFNLRGHLLEIGALMPKLCDNSLHISL